MRSHGLILIALVMGGTFLGLRIPNFWHSSFSKEKVLASTRLNIPAGTPFILTRLAQKSPVAPSRLVPPRKFFKRRFLAFANGFQNVESTIPSTPTRSIGKFSGAGA